jgi:hypothetical protein
MFTQPERDSVNMAEQSNDLSSSTEITVILPQVSVNGIVRYREQFRILDVLNQGFIGPGQKSKPDFITLINSSLTDSQGAVILETPRLYIAKKNILFVLESNWASQQSNGQTKTSVKAHLFRNKKPVIVSVSLPGYTLEGAMFTESQMPINMLLEQQESFIPMTDIVIKSHCSVQENSAKFAAVNKKHILYLSEN